MKWKYKNSYFRLSFLTTFNNFPVNIIDETSIKRVSTQTVLEVYKKYEKKTSFIGSINWVIAI